MPWWISLILGIVVAVILAIAALRARRWHQSHGTRQKLLGQCSLVNASETIFVMIPNYRDPECARTVYDVFMKAYCPYRVFVGVCDQIKLGEEADCRTKVKSLLANTKRESGIDLSCFDHNLRVLVLPAHEAKGPMFARAQIETNLYRGEMFVLCMDSHMVMVQDWDKKAIAQLRRCQVTRDSKPILTMHPDTWINRNSAQLLSSTDEPENDWQGDLQLERPARYLCAGKVQQDSGLIELASRPLSRIPVRPLRQLFYSPCFSFTYASAHKDVPMDPDCPYLFSGEEIALTVRFWTHGWDFYVPFTMLCLHKSDRSYRPTFWELGKSSVKAEKRIQALIGVRPLNSVKPPSLVRDIDVGQKYGPGTVRSIQDYERFAGVDFANCKADKRSVMGLVNEMDSVEVLSKYGSNEAFVFAERNSKDLKFRHH